MKNNYSDLLKDPRWQKKRLEILQRDNFKCMLCGDETTSLNIHHKEYVNDKKPWEYENITLITICENCHYIVKLAKKENIDFSDRFILKTKSENGSKDTAFFISDNNSFHFIALDKNGEFYYNIFLGKKAIDSLIVFLSKIKNNG
jgi:hypothetical protein